MATAVVGDDEREETPNDGRALLNLGHTFDKEKPVEGAKFLREPTRATLTEPPAGYRSPSPDQPYGLNYRGEKGKALTQEERQTQGSKDR